uniref:Pre-SET domain-containing protein n=1 Tax=Leersia perrieri TaxID=77586 RepID=A0A0D9X6V8_9ORYZ
MAGNQHILDAQDSTIHFDSDEDESMPKSVLSMGKSVRGKRGRPQKSAQESSMSMITPEGNNTASLTHPLPIVDRSGPNHPRDTIEDVLMTFGALKRRIMQLKDVKGASKQHIFKALRFMEKAGYHVNRDKRVGEVPGVEIGDMFYFKMEMLLVGLHSNINGGIESMSFAFAGKEEKIATCIVSSGLYENDDDDPYTLIYNGQGKVHQKLQGESTCVCVVNEIDNEDAPRNFTYSIKLDIGSHLVSVGTMHRCECTSSCPRGEDGCSCSKKNGSYLPYTTTGILVCRMPVIYECSNLCACNTYCPNRVVQRGCHLHFEIFKTTTRGWGLRSWDPIPAGAFICEYAGVLIDRHGLIEEDEYIFEVTGFEHNLKWNYIPELLGEPSLCDMNNTFKKLPMVISAKHKGNNLLTIMVKVMVQGVERQKFVSVSHTAAKVLLDNKQLQKKTAQQTLFPEVYFILVLFMSIRV